MTVPPCNEIWIQFYDLVMELQQKLAFCILQYQLSFLDHLALYRSQRVADTDCMGVTRSWKGSIVRVRLDIERHNQWVCAKISVSGHSEGKLVPCSCGQSRWNIVLSLNRSILVGCRCSIKGNEVQGSEPQD